MQGQLPALQFKISSYQEKLFYLTRVSSNISRLHYEQPKWNPVHRKQNTSECS